jgi:hypothetical protein
MRSLLGTTPFVTLTPLVFVARCGLLGGPNAPVGSTPTTTPSSDTHTPSTSTSPAAMDDEVRTLITHALTPQMCPRMLGTFLGLPGEGSASGPAAGALPSVGRWWIRSCEARAEDGRIHLSIGGPGWTWVDRASNGFRVRQYLLFEAQAAFGADVALGYDRTTRVATLWMRPAEGVDATITPRGVVSAEATGFFATLLGGIAAVTGNDVNERARQQAGALGSAMLRERLAVGFTMTLALERNQMDFMVGSLHRGEVPERPYPPSPHGPWVVNQRSTVWPGGLDVVGPIDPRNGPLGLDLALEEGDGAVVRAHCAEALTRYFEARFRTPDLPPPAPPTGVVVAELSAGADPLHLRLPDNVPGSPCALLLTLAPRGNSLPVRLRYRVAPEPPNTPARTTTRRVRVQIVGAIVAHANPSGHAWDVVGGEADLTVITASIPLGRVIDTAPVVPDRDDASWHRWLPGSYDVAHDLPLRFSVFDDDTTTREFIGMAELDAARVPNSPGDFTLPLRSEGPVPRQTGTLRLRVEVLP